MDKDVLSAKLESLIRCVARIKSQNIENEEGFKALTKRSISFMKRNFTQLSNYKKKY